MAYCLPRNFCDHCSPFSSGSFCWRSWCDVSAGSGRRRDYGVVVLSLPTILRRVYGINILEGIRNCIFDPVASLVAFC